jgi:hypothetical protein
VYFCLFAASAGQLLFLFFSEVVGREEDTPRTTDYPFTGAGGDIIIIIILFRRRRRLSFLPFF